jgi:hypothetical protein
MPGPTYTRPPQPTDRTPERRRALDALLARRVEALQARTNPPVSSDELALLAAIVESFAEAVDRDNSSRGILRVGVATEYVDAVVLCGSAGELVVEAPDYDGAPVYWQARAGEVDSIVHGADLDAYLRTGEARYAQAIGLR